MALHASTLSQAVEHAGEHAAEPVAWAGFAADVVVGVHFAIVLFVILVLPFVIVGGLLGWRAARSLWLRSLHFVAILVVAGESLTSVACPLTTWEHDLRVAAGQFDFTGRQVDDLGFFAGFVRDWLFIEMPEDLDEEGRRAFLAMFQTWYLGYAALTAWAFVFFPPSRRKRRPCSSKP